MKAIILAAGRGSRMGNKTETLPKCLTKLWGKTLLEWQLKAIREAGINEIAIVTGYHSEQIKEVGTKYFHNAEWEVTNMFVSLTKAQEWLENDECIVSYSDVFYDKDAILSLIKVDTDIAITSYTDFLPLWEKRFKNPLDDIETFKMNSDYELIEIGNKANSLAEIEGQYMGLLKFTPKGWQSILDKIKNYKLKPIAKLDITSMLSYMIANDVQVKVCPYSGVWLEVDNQKDLSLYENMKKI